jgi:hypothetical protein
MALQNAGVLGRAGPSLPRRRGRRTDLERLADGAPTSGVLWRRAGVLIFPSFAVLNSVFIRVGRAACIVRNIVWGIVPTTRGPGYSRSVSAEFTHLCKLGGR